MEILKSALFARFEGDKVAICAIEGGYNNGDSVYTLPSDAAPTLQCVHLDT